MTSSTYPKTFGTKAYPVECLSSSNLLGRVAPLITPEELKEKYLKGIDIKEWDTEDLKREIEYACNEFELMTGLDLVPTTYKDRIPYDRQLYKSFVHIKTMHGPIWKVHRLWVESSNGENIYELPADWIEMGLAHKKQINLIPLLSLFAGQSQTGLTQSASSTGLIFLSAISNLNWMPAFWSIEYTASISHLEGTVPIVANDVVGMTAAIAILSAKQTQFRHTSQSISQDSISQSSSSPGTQVYQPRILLLTDKRDKMLQKIKSKFSNKYHLSNI